MATSFADTSKKSFHELMREACVSRYFSGSGPLRLKLVEDDPTSAMHFVLGDNGAGKSFLVQLMSAYAKRQQCTPLQVSMAYRTRGGVERAMMYGSEDDQSTGCTSISVVRGAVRSMHSWKGKDHMALFDEPDTGLSDRYAYPMGKYLAQYAVAPAPGCRGVLVITHSRALVKGALTALAQADRTASVAVVGDCYDSLEGFLASTDYASVEEMELLDDQAIVAWRTLNKIIADKANATQ